MRISDWSSDVCSSDFVGLDDDGNGKAFEHRECFLGGGAAHIGGGRDRRARAEILGEALRAFEPRGGGARAEDGDVDLAQAIGETRDERGFGADDDEIDSVRLYEGEKAGDVVGGNANAFGIRSGEQTSELQALMRI